MKVGDESKWAELIKGSTGVVNLAGPPISTRWTPEVRKLKNLSSLSLLMFLRDLACLPPSSTCCF